MQYSWKNTCVGISFNKVAGRPATLSKRDSNKGGFSVNIAKCLQTPFFTEQLQWLLPDQH